jgi:hypothetical protein
MDELEFFFIYHAQAIAALTVLAAVIDMAGGDK